MKGAKILIVDQAEQDIELMASILDHEGCTMIRGVAATSEAERICEVFHPHLVLLNVSSVGPGIVSFIEKIREPSGPETLPSVLAFSADTSRQTRRLALASGADDFLPKPLDHTEFLLRCRKLIRERLLLEQLREQIAWRKEMLRHFVLLQNNQHAGFGAEAELPWALS